MTNNQTNFVIFSKDRACQLHACLESLYDNFHSIQEPTITVIWKATDDYFRSGYEKLMNFYPATDSLVWEEEYNFKKQTRKAVKGFPWAPPQFTIFLVDDIIFTNSVSTEDQQFSMIKNNSMMVGASLRLHENANHCYATNEPQTVPKFVKKIVWSWTNASGDWAYPMSVDGNVYNTHFIESFVDAIDFYNPNTLEAALDLASKQGNAPAYMCCYPEAPRLINIPANKVQTVFNNRSMEQLSTKDINEKYLNGQKINISAYKEIRPNTVHVPLELMFTKNHLTQTEVTG